MGLSSWPDKFDKDPYAKWFADEKGWEYEDA